MKKNLIEKVLPLFYVSVLFIALFLGINFYKTKKERSNILLKIGNNVNIEEVGNNILLETIDNLEKDELIYEIENENIIKKEDDGSLTGVNNGSTKVTVTNQDKSISQTFTVNVGQEAIKEYKENTKYSTSNKNNNSSSSSSNNNNNYNNISSNKNNIIKVSSVSLNKTSSEIYLNSKTKTISLTANILPTNATNKAVTWSSSNTNVATVNNGAVTAKSPGTATITVKTVDGKKTASTNIIVKKKVIIIIGASQVTRMADYKKSYSSPKYNYSVDEGTLLYVEKGGSGMNYQVNEGFQIAKNKIAAYSNVKNYTYFHIFFPLVGNSIKTFKCSDISASNKNIINYAKNYNNSILTIKNMGYNVRGYVVSMHPVRVGQAKNNKFVVANENANSCTENYRSNWKYYKFNTAMKNIVINNYSNNLTYESLFVKIMNVNSEGKNFSYKITYNTDDGVHWDKATTETYVNMMLNYTNDL